MSINKSATGKAKKNDDLIEVEVDNGLEFSTDEVPVTKPGLLEKRERSSRGPRSTRNNANPENELFDIE